MSGNARFQAGQRGQMRPACIWLAVLGEEATMTGAMILPIRSVPLHDAAHVGAGC